MKDKSNERVVIWGVGGLGRELLGWMRSAAQRAPDDPLQMPTAFVSDFAKKDEVYAGIPVLQPADLEGQPVKFYVGLSDPQTKRTIVERALSYGWEPLSYFDPTSVVGANVHFGRGVVVNPGSTISSDVSIGNFVLVNCNTGVGHDCVVGEFSSLLGSNAVNGHVTVGSFCTIGAGSTIHPKISIGDNATVGIGSVVIAKVKSGITVFGNPARIQRV